jgi:hypothetical protein
MIQGHLNELRSVVERATDLPEETRARLLQLTAELEQDVLQGGGGVSATAASAATTDSPDDSIATAPEASGATGLVSAIEGLESSHPEVTATVSNVARMLSKLGF